jgi:hypothetical protein
MYWIIAKALEIGFITPDEAPLIAPDGITIAPDDEPPDEEGDRGARDRDTSLG